MSVSLNKILLDNVIYVGNDINDEDVMKISGVTFCPADAHQRIKKMSNYVLTINGGDGVVREILDYLTIKGD
mgnify:CR=1 FL=1